MRERWAGSRPGGERTRPATGSVLALLATAMLLVAGWRIVAASGHWLWLDELYTLTLVEAPSLGHMVSGAVRGVDGNPPLYMALAWALTHAVPAAPELVLRLFNLAALAGTAVLLYRLGRRVADPLGVAAGLAILCATDDTVGYALLETRTYALYLLATAATLAAAVHLIDEPTRRRTAALAALGVVAALSHTFGGLYVAVTLAAAGAVSRHDRARRRALIAAALPPFAATAGWIAVSLPAQLAVASPYGWIRAPDLAALFQALTGSPLLTPLLGLGLAAAAMRRPAGLLRLSTLGRARPDLAALYGALAGFAALTVAVWAASQVTTPVFVPRYFIPNLVIPALLIVPAVGFAQRRARPALAASALGIATLAGLVGIASAPETSFIPCLRADGRFLEEEAARGGLPVVAVSPHAWLPRSRYAPAQTTLYPLDWQVVLRQPDRARNNAMDFHIMEILRDWSPPGSALATEVLSTEAILARYRHVLVLDEASRGWFAELRARVPLTADLVTEGPGCRLWDVRTPAVPGGAD